MLLLRLLSVVVMIAVMLPANAVTLQPGTYSLEWKIPAEDSNQQSSDTFIFLNPVDITDEIEGLVSANCMYGKTGQFEIILDESAGTGKGYDTAYLFVGSIDEEKQDITQAIKILLVKEEEDILFSKDSYTIDLPVMEKGVRVTEKAIVKLAFSIREVDLEQENGARGQYKVGYANISIRGGLFGKIKTDLGEIQVQVIDENGNGVYGDLSTNEEEDFDDMFMLSDASQQEVKTAYFNQAITYGGKLYVFVPNEANNTIEVKQYTGPVGKLDIEAKDSYGKPIGCSSISVYGENFSDWDMTEGSDIPVGEYECSVDVVPNEDEEFYLTIDAAAKPVKIEKDKTTTLRIGGPISLKIGLPSDTIIVKRGEELNIALLFTVGNDKLSGVGEDRQAAINIRDAKGKLLISGKAGFG